MPFIACCFISCAIIFLYSTRSDLLDRVLPAIDIAYINGYIKLAPTSIYHTIKVIAALKDLANLAIVPWPLNRHSPSFVCGLVLGCIIQLAVASIHVCCDRLDCLQQYRDTTGLILGALHGLGER